MLKEREKCWLEVARLLLLPKSDLKLAAGETLNVTSNQNA
jgi:hypothetical protein